jgi:hypothetical protein
MVQLEDMRAVVGASFVKELSLDTKEMPMIVIRKQ